MTTSTKKASADSLTPMMRQYMEIKQRNPDTVLLYRMGDFYEMFNEDAQIAAKVLGLTLTSRNHGGTEATPLAGFPHHAVERYAHRLVKAGYRIAVCEQTEDPKAAKGLVKRDVTEVITAGTAMEGSFIDERSNNYIVAIVAEGACAGMGVCDLSTGDFSVEELRTERLDEELMRLDPAEVVVAGGVDQPAIEDVLSRHPTIVITRLDGWKFTSEHATEALTKHFGVASLAGMGLEGTTLGIAASGALLMYLKEQKRSDLRHITTLRPRALGEYAELDPSSIRNLELLKPLHSDESGGTLLSAIDRSSSAMGARLLKRWITHPLLDIKAIRERLDGVEWLRSDVFVRREVELFLHGIADIERLIGRVTLERANGRDLISLRRSLALFPRIIKTLTSSSPPPIATRIATLLEGFGELAQRIGAVLVDDPPLSVREGGLVRKGYSSDLDELIGASTHGKQWIAGLQQSERDRTGIASLKVGYNKVFGYYIEVSKANLETVPEDYIRKQTLVNGERFITPGLKEMEEKILGAEERRAALEYEVFATLRTEVAQWCPRIQKAAEAVAVLDVLVAFARVAAEHNYVRPELDNSVEMHKIGRASCRERV